MDRHGRLLAYLRRTDGLWIQGELLRLGIARAYSFPDNRAVVNQMLTSEQSTRNLRRVSSGIRFMICGYRKKRAISSGASGWCKERPWAWRKKLQNFMSISVQTDARTLS